MVYIAMNGLMSTDHSTPYDGTIMHTIQKESIASVWHAIDIFFHTYLTLPFVTGNIYTLLQ